MLRDYQFHDATIKHIEYDHKIATLFVCKSHYNGALADLKIEIEIEEYNLDIFHFKRFPFFHKVKLVGKECSFQTLKNMLKDGKILEIVEVWTSTYSSVVIFECAVLPYDGTAGVSKNILLKFRDCNNIEVKQV